MITFPVEITLIYKPANQLKEINIKIVIVVDKLYIFLNFLFIIVFDFTNNNFLLILNFLNTYIIILMC